MTQSTEFQQDPPGKEKTVIFPVVYCEGKYLQG